MTTTFQSISTQPFISPSTLVTVVALSLPSPSIASTSGESGFDNGVTTETGNSGGASGSDPGSHSISSGALAAIIAVIVVVVGLGGKSNSHERR